MAQIVTISEATYREGINEIGDVVGIYDDIHEFSIRELEVFNIIKIAGDAATVRMAQRAVIPEIKIIYQSKTTEWTDERPAEKQVWNNDGEWYDLANQPKI